MTQHSPEKAYLPNEASGNKISLIDIVNFLVNSWKTIAIFGCLGLVGSLTYLFVTPNQYEARAQIRMAQISNNSTGNPLGMAFEDPLSLMGRMQYPTNYSEAVVNACAYQDKQQPSLALSKDLKYSVPKGTANTLELRVISASAQIAGNCAQAVFEQIKMLQAQLAEPLIKEAQMKLAFDNERIDSTRKLISRADQSGGAISAIYLSGRDELAYYLIDREKTTDLINSIINRGTRLSSPIYAAEKPVSPKKRASLVAGLFGGFFLGLMIALVRQMLVGLKSQKDSLDDPM
jgi:hypothetical protein